MKKQSLIFRFRAWVNNIPIEDPVNRQMGALLQVILIGLIVIFILAVIITLFMPSSTAPIMSVVVRFLFGSLIFGTPLLFLRLGYYRSAVYLILALLLLLMTYAVFDANLRDIAENLTFFTLAIVLAGLLAGRRTLIITFVVSATAVLLSAFRQQDPSSRSGEMAIAANFILLNGLMSVFLNYFGVTLRNTLRSALQREEELRVEVAHREQAEKQVNAVNQELQQIIAELERFTYTVSHDLRSPLVTIKGFLGMLKDDLEKNRPEKVQSDIERIDGATKKMNELLSDLLELSRIGRVTNPPEEIDTLQLIKDAIESVDAHIRSANVTLKVQAAFPNIHGDPTRLREVFENLLDNATKYIGDQAHPIIEIGTLQVEGELIFFVKDNGMGIEPQYHDKVFGLFEKLNPTIEGTGIGLSLIKRIVETHGGRMWVESEGLGKGSTFCFTIPDNHK